MKKTLSIIIILLLLLCTKSEAGKKGVAGPGGCPNLDLSFLYNVLGVDWGYVWHYRTQEPVISVEFVPMVRSIHSQFSVDDVANIVLWYGAGGYWLIGNEPDNQWQDNLTPMEAAIAYGEIINVILGTDPAAKIVLGNFTSPSQYFRETWLEQFKSAWMTVWNEDVTAVIAGWGVHAYAHPYAAETQQNAIGRVQRQITAWQSEYPDLELWVTEFGNLQETDVETMRQMTIWLDANVDRYAYFYFGDEAGDWEFTSLYVEPWPLPQLTELGEAYIDLPPRTPTLIPTFTPKPSMTPSATLTMTSSVTPLPPTPTMTPTQSPTPSSTFTPSPNLTPTRISIFIEPRLEMTVSPDPDERDMQKTYALFRLTNHARAAVIGLFLALGLLGGDFVVKLRKS